MDKIAVLIPCYNESKTIAKVVADYKKYLPTAPIYVYDNNSSDDSVQLAQEAGAIVRYERQQGKGNVVRRMFREIDAECYIMVDGDDTYPADCVMDLANEILNNHMDMVVGDRLSSTYFSENKRHFHNLGNSIVRKSINVLFKSDIKDIMTGYRAFSYEFVKTFPVLSQYFEIETEMTIHAIDKRMEIANVVIEYRDRSEGSESKLNTFSDGYKVLRTISKLFRAYKPLCYFGILCAFLLLVATILFIPVFAEYWQTGLVNRFPTLIVCGFIVIAAIQAMFSGLVLENLLHVEKHDFENRLHDVHARKMTLLSAIEFSEKEST